MLARPLSVLIGLLVIAEGVTAAPWIEPGDLRMRHSLQDLNDRGNLQTPLTTWPVPWINVQSPQRTENASNLPDTWNYVDFEARQQARVGSRVTLELGGASEPQLFRGFSQRPREQGELGSSTEWTGERFALRFSPSFNLDPQDGKQYRLDESFAAANLGNWIVGFGAIERWWGPGWQSSLILSNNARPVPGVWLSRKQALAPESSWLQWLGPWTFTAFAGQLEGARAVPQAKFIGLRWAAMPLRNLEVGLSRTAQWAGEGRPGSLSSLTEALGQSDDIHDLDDVAGNGLTALDFRWGFSLGNSSGGIYGQLLGDEDLAPGFDHVLAGADLATQAWGGGQRLYLEYSQTGRNDDQSVAYEHPVYSSGYRFRGRNLASTWESGARTISLGAIQFLADGSDAGISLTRAELGREAVAATMPHLNKIQYNQAAEPQDVWVADVFYRFVILNGRTTLFGQWISDEMQTFSGEASALSFGVSWQYRF